MANQYPARSLSERFWNRVDQSAGTYGCWPWMGARFHYGHGAVKVNGRPWGAHRIAWELVNGPAPEGENVLHICDNPPCCNPRHLYVGSLADNARDMVSRGRHRHGENHAFAKLTTGVVIDARSRFQRGEQIKNIAPTLGVSAGSLAKAIHGITWRHVPGAVPVAHPHRKRRKYVRRAA